MSLHRLPEMHTIEWDSEIGEYVSVYHPAIEPINYLKDGDVYPEEAFYDPMCMINCFNCDNIDGLTKEQVSPMCENADAFDHNICFLCNICYKKLRDYYFIKNHTNIVEHKKERIFVKTPCGRIIDFE